MPKATATQRQENLARLQGSLAPHCPPDSRCVSEANRWATTLPLTHSLSFGKLGASLRDGELRSQQLLGKPAGKAELLLDTTDDVFLYVGPFTYPDTECGFLFVHSLEDDHRAEGVATPFDSGALAHTIAPPAGYENGVACVRAHELPLVEHRALLAQVIAGFLPTPDAYLTRPNAHACPPCGKPLDHPFGLKGGDGRASTFEVRIPQRVPLRPPHLRAVFVREGQEIAELSEIYAAGIPIERFPADDGADFFHALRESCISFILEHLVA